jgi:long-subunit acyl-CoA synthetase (AMP-forming)
MQVYPTTVAELVGDVCQCDGAKPALIFEDQPISYADLDQRIGRAANGLVAHGVAQGDRVALWESLTNFSSAERTPVRVSPDDLATICYTSGTTGPAKGAMLTHRNFISNCEQLDLTDRGRAKRSDVLLLFLPLFHFMR